MSRRDVLLAVVVVAAVWYLDRRRPHRDRPAAPQAPFREPAMYPLRNPRKGAALRHGLRARQARERRDRARNREYSLIIPLSWEP